MAGPPRPFLRLAPQGLRGRRRWAAAPEPPAVAELTQGVRDTPCRAVQAVAAEGELCPGPGGLSRSGCQGRLPAALLPGGLGRGSPVMLEGAGPFLGSSVCHGLKHWFACFFCNDKKVYFGEVRKLRGSDLPSVYNQASEM